MGGFEINREQWGKCARKLLLQFGYTSKEKIQRLIDVALNQNRKDIDGYKKVIEVVCDECETCIKLRRNHEKPSVFCSWKGV